MLADEGDNSQALDYYRKSLQVYENGSAKAPDDLTLRLCVAICRAGIGKLQARLRQSVPAIDNCQKAITILAGINEEPSNANDRGLKAQAYHYIGEAYAAMAASKGVTAPELTKHWAGARDVLQRSLEIYKDMCSRGILSASDARQFDGVAGEIAKCDAALRK